MSKNMIIGVVVVIVILLGLGWWWYSNNSSMMSPNSASTSQTNPANMTPEQMQQMDNTQQPTQTPSGAHPPSVPIVPASSGSSDASLNQDAAQIDTQMNGLNSDNANATQSLNSQ